MPRVMLSWIGWTDRRAPQPGEDNVGPIAQALAQRPFDHVVLLSENSGESPKSDGKRGLSSTVDYIKWLEARGEVPPLTPREVELPGGPSCFKDIHEAVCATIDWTLKRFGEDTKLVFYLSPGTQVMGATWLIMATSRYPAQLIESSDPRHVRDVEIPFQLSPLSWSKLGSTDTFTNWLSGLAGTERDFQQLARSFYFQSARMKRVVARARVLASIEDAICITGETGTGKSILARHMHTWSDRKERPFIVINCGALPENLIESELFGTEKGAASGTVERPGVFEAADGGTVFLDEIGEMSLQAQVRLLLVVQEKVVTRLGSTKAKKVDFRLICATNRELEVAVAEGRFREDLYYRVATELLALPPLRERQDLGYVIDETLKALRKSLKNEGSDCNKELSLRSRNALLRYAWPGNFRELEATLKRAMRWSPNAEISEEDVLRELRPIRRIQETAILDRPLGDDFSLKDVLGEVERHYYSRAVAEAHGIKKDASGLLGIKNYQTMDNRMKKLGMGSG
jgi:DNA-binding NtrC family response regulator